MTHPVSRVKSLPDVDLNQLSKDELVEKIRKLEAANLNLKNILAKRNRAEGGDSRPDGNSEGASSTSSSQKRKPFDFSRYNKRHVALHVAYFGWDWQGYVVQDNTTNTVESALFEALERTRLIESRETSNYHRCGRTDKGVSALGQVVSIDLRSNLDAGVGLIPTSARSNGAASSGATDMPKEEIRYAHILNKVLPRDIRVLGWTPVEPDFSARFDCNKRVYTYFFPKGNLNLDLMAEAGKLLVGEHDFRNVCKMDVGNGITTFVRRIDSVDVSTLESTFHFKSRLLQQSGMELCQLCVTGSGFLWHQIRCIVALLFLVGERLEPPVAISKLLDVANHPRKPQYNMAADFPLNLYSCEFPAVAEWVADAEALVDLVLHYQKLSVELSVKSALCVQALELAAFKAKAAVEERSGNEEGSMSSRLDAVSRPHRALVSGSKSRKHKPLFERPLCESLEDRVEHFVKRRRIIRLEEAGCGGKDVENGIGGDASRDKAELPKYPVSDS